MHAVGEGAALRIVLGGMRYYMDLEEDRWADDTGIVGLEPYLEAVPLAGDHRTVVGLLGVVEEGRSSCHGYSYDTADLDRPY